MTINYFKSHYKDIEKIHIDAINRISVYKNLLVYSKKDNVYVFKKVKPSGTQYVAWNKVGKNLVIAEQKFRKSLIKSLLEVNVND